MKSISKMLIAAGTGILFLICILIGVLYYRNLNRNEEEMAVTIEKNLEQYLNERVSELHPQFLEQEDSKEKMEQISKQILQEIAKKLNKENLTWEELLQYYSEEQIQEVLDYVVNHFKDDWLSQFINEAGDTFITEEEYKVIGEEFFAALQNKLLEQLEQTAGEEREKLLAILEQLKEETQSSISSANERVTAVEKKISDMEGNAQGNRESILNVQNILQSLRSNVNIKIDRWDEETQTLYLVPVK